MNFEHKKSSIKNLFFEDFWVEKLQLFKHIQRQDKAVCNLYSVQDEGMKCKLWCELILSNSTQSRSTQ